MDKVKTARILDKITEWALYILVFIIPFSKTAIEACILVAFLSWVSRKVLLKDFSLEKTPVNSALFALFIISALSIINADFKLLAMRALVSKCLKYILLYFIVVESMNTKTKVKNLLKMVCISASIVMIDAYLQYYVLHKDVFKLCPSFKYRPDRMSFGLGFPTGPFGFPNDLSAWMLVILLPALSLFIWEPITKAARFALGFALSPFLFLFYLANTRSAWLGLFISFFLLVFIRNKRLFTIFMAVFLATVLIMAFFLPREKIHDITGLSSVHDRFYMWRIGWKVFLEHPVIGNGINTFYGKFKELREDKSRNLLGSYAHNGFLQIAADTGIMGLAVFLLLIVRIFNGVFRCRRAIALGLAGGLLAFLIHSFFDTNLHSLPLVTLFWFGMGLLISLQRIKDFQRVNAEKI